MSYLTEGIKKLRAVYVTQAKEEATSTVRLWRGMRNLDVGDKFLADRRGGTEARSLPLRARVCGYWARRPRSMFVTAPHRWLRCQRPRT